MIGEKYYKLFGLKKGCSEEEIRKKYKSLAKRYHPDHNKSLNANEKFIEIQKAYEYLLQDIKGKRKSDNNEDDFQEYRTRENEWILYRKRAYERYRAKKRKERKELEDWCKRIDLGFRKSALYFTAFISIFIIVAMLVDDFLPPRKEESRIDKYSTIQYKSMNNKPVMVAETFDGKSYWLNSFNTRELNRYPKTHIEKTAIFGHPQNLIVYSGMNIQYVPIHFNFYWAQLVVFSILLIPILACLYRNKDVFKIMLYYSSVFGIGALQIYFFVTEERLFNLFSFIFR